VKLPPVIVHGVACVGGAAARPIDPDVVVAPLRPADALPRTPPPDPHRPWDPWDPVRIGYDGPAPGSLLYPDARVMRYLAAWIEEQDARYRF
jgi:hypothetical protein